jgi:6-pyruvoyl-tetrahydropterin synthase
MYSVGIKRQFTTGHFLVGDFGEETKPHSHVYTAEWFCSTDELDENDFAVNIALMEEVLERVVDGLSDKLLNDLDFFKGRQASVENLARFILRSLVGPLEKGGMDLARIKSTELRVWESETAWASFTTDSFRKA